MGLLPSGGDVGVAGEGVGVGERIGSAPKDTDISAVVGELVDVSDVGVPVAVEAARNRYDFGPVLNF